MLIADAGPATPRGLSAHIILHMPFSARFILGMPVSTRCIFGNPVTTRIKCHTSYDASYWACCLAAPPLGTEHADPHGLGPIQSTREADRARTMIPPFALPCKVLVVLASSISGHL